MLGPVRLIASAAALVATLSVTACAAQFSAPAQAGGSSKHRPAAASRASASSPTPSPTPNPDAPLPVAPGTGKLPQTTARPRAYGPAWHAMVTDLWLAVRTGKPNLARQAFFPVDAYKQVKAIYNPGSDWRWRLWLEFTLDVKAAHALLGSDPASARLVRVIVAEPYATWITPGVCYNRIGYWHVANARVVYRQNGQERSFGIASLISWRGVWYVVHFGGVTRGNVGMVDSPAAGPGYDGPQGGC